ncbi:MAG: hypothetical protein KF810_02705 [Rhizobiaceae bacterium]|nr:hypothetical protein [Rhizobiaceae bacterium]
MKTAGTCPVEGCERAIPGRFNSFCAFHHFMIPAEYTRSLMRMKIECANTTDDDARAQLQERLPTYIRLAMSKLPQDRRASA